MSREYKLVFDDSDVVWHVIDSLKSSDACIKAQAQGVCLDSSFKCKGHGNYFQKFSMVSGAVVR